MYAIRSYYVPFFIQPVDDIPEFFLVKPGSLLDVGKCYAVPVFADDPDDFFGSPSCFSCCPGTVFDRAGCLRSPFFLVITSYSIHYTKLYESQTEPHENNSRNPVDAGFEILMNISETV